MPTTRAPGQPNPALIAPVTTTPLRKRSRATTSLRQLLVVVVVLGALGGMGVLAFRGLHKVQQKTGGVTTAPADPFASYEVSTIEPPNFSASHSAMANPDGSVVEVDGPVRLWLPSPGTRKVMVDPTMPQAALYTMPAPSQIVVMVEQMTIDATGKESATATAIMTSDSGSYTEATPVELPSFVGKTFRIDLMYPDGLARHSYVTIAGRIAVMVVSFAGDDSDHAVMDQIIHSVTVDDRHVL